MSRGALAAGEFLGRVQQRFARGGVELAEVFHARAASLPRHLHIRPYFSLLLRGEYSDAVGSKSRDIRPLSITFSPAGFEHTDRIGEGGALFFTMSLDDELAGTLASSGSCAVKVPQLWSRGDLALELLRLHAAFVTHPGMLDALALQDCVLLAFERIEKTPHRLEHAPRWLRAACDRMHDSIDAPLTVLELAGDVGVHPVHFSRVFRYTMGTGPAAYRARIRVVRACGLLAGSRTSLADVALQLGFADQSHLTHMFKRLVGIPPGAYRTVVAGPR